MGQAVRGGQIKVALRWLVGVILLSIATACTTNTQEISGCSDLSKSCVGRFQAPLDWDDPALGEMTVGFQWRPRGDLSQPSAGVIITASGGPGGANSFDPWEEILSDIRNRYDLLLFEYRGVGVSEYFGCDGVLGLIGIGDTNEACEKKIREEGRFYSYYQSVNDLAHIADSLGIEDFILYGQSFGTFFVQTFAHRFPDSASAVILESTVPFAGEPWRPTQLQRTFELIGEVCSESPNCAALGDGAEIWREFVTRQRENGFSDYPLEILVALQLTFPHNETSSELVRSAYLANQGDHGPMAALVECEQAWRTNIREEMSATRIEGHDPSFSAAVAMAVNCSDLPMPFDREADSETRAAQTNMAIRAVTPEVPIAFTAEEVASVQPNQAAQCVELSEENSTLDRLRESRIQPNISALFINGEYDPVTTVAQGAEAASEFKNSRHIIVKKASHWPSYSVPCVRPLITQFIETGRRQIEFDSTSCEAPPTVLRGLQ